MEALSNDAILAATLAHSDGAGPGPSPAAASVRGLSIGRYLLLAQIGAGAMGIVFAAYDPELDRRVALKILKHAAGDVAASRKRLQREAQALAKLGHPNVVAVHDVGVHEEQLFVAMEFVAGKTLGAWMGEARAAQTTASGGAGGAERSARVRPWREVLDVLMQAGRGLAAAHEAGLVHRDFKPDNVMLSEDGRVRVMDFGLARVDEDRLIADRETDPRGGDLTQAGAIVGTPAYMSLEQFEARHVDERGDQFSFCVALYEALYGERPFVGATIVELVDALRAGTLREAPRGTLVPGWLRAVLARGLARDPAARFASMHALLTALAADPVAYRRRLAARIGLALALALSAWGVVHLSIRLGQRDAVIAEQAGALDQKDAALAGQLVTQTRLLSEQRGLRAMALVPEAREAEALLLGVQAVGAFAPAWTDIPRAALQGLEHVLAHDTVLVTDERVLAGHRDYLTDVEYSPDGARLATASVDGSARIWDVASGALLAELAGHVGAVQAVVFAPDGAHLATAGLDHGVRVWDVATGTQRARAELHTDSVRKLVYSPDGARLASASLDGSARVWDAATGEPLLTLRSPDRAAVLDVAFTPDGSRIATADHDVARLWHARSGALLATLAGHTGTIFDLEFSPDGTRLATASRDRTARTWHVATGEPVAVLAGHGDRVAAVAFAPDGARVVTLCWDSVGRVFDPESGALLHELSRGHSAGLVALAFRPDGARVVTTSYEGTVTVWDPASGAAVERLVGHPSDVWDVDYAPDGRHVVTAGVDGTARIWTLDYPRVATRVGPEQRVRTFAYTPDHRRVATIDAARRARVWDATSGEVLATLGDGEVRGLAVSPDGRYVATVDAAQLEIRDATTGAVVATGEAPPGAEVVDYSPDGARLYPRGGTNLWIVDAATAGRLATVALSGTIYDHAFSADGATLATAAEEPFVRVWDARSGALVASLPHADADVRQLEGSPDGALLATAQRDAVHLWDAHTHAHLARCEGHRGLPRGLEFSPDGARLVATSDDAGAWVWDTATCRLVARYEPDDHNPKTGAAVFAPDGRRVAILSDRIVRLWSTESQGVLADLDGHDTKVLSAVFSPDGARLTTRTTGALKVWDVARGELVSRERIGVVAPDGSIVWPTDPRELTRIGCERLRMYGRVHAQVDDICAPLVAAHRPPTP